MTEALYRKYRPSTFRDVVGQEHIERTLKNAIEQDKVSHAYLFCGPRGTGKTTTARILAKALLCEKGPTTEPDGTCAECQAIANGNHPDVYELDAASRTGVENVREEIISRVNYAPTRGLYKVYIIDEVHMLSTAAFNALLKTLEEPPSHVIFILCTTDPQKVPETIHSRCQRFDFHRISVETIVSRLGAVCVQENVEFEPEALELVAYRSDGGMRNALTSLEQLIAFGEGTVTLKGAQNLLGSLDDAGLSEIVQAIGKRDVASCFVWISHYVETGADLAQFALDLAEHLRNLYLLSVAKGEIELPVPDSSREVMKKELAFYSSDRLSRLLGILDEVMKELRVSSNPRLSFEIALTRMVRPESDLTLEALAERVEELEKRLSGAINPADSYVVPISALNETRITQSSLAKAQGTVRAGGVSASSQSKASTVSTVSMASAMSTVSAARTVAAASMTPAAPGMSTVSADSKLPMSSSVIPGVSAASVAQAARAEKKITTSSTSTESFAASMTSAVPAPGMSAVPTTPTVPAASLTSLEPNNPSVQQNTSVVPEVSAAGIPALSAVKAPISSTVAVSSPASSTVETSTLSAAVPTSAIASQVPGSIDLSNPAKVQRMWHSVVSSLRKTNPARGVLFMNARISATEQNEFLIEFSAESGFAYAAAQKPEVQDLLKQTIQSVLGAAIPFRLKIAGQQPGPSFGGGAPQSAPQVPVESRKISPRPEMQEQAHPVQHPAQDASIAQSRPVQQQPMQSGRSVQSLQPSQVAPVQPATQNQSPVTQNQPVVQKQPAVQNQSVVSQQESNAGYRGFSQEGKAITSENRAVPSGVKQSPSSSQANSFDDDRVPLDVYDSFAPLSQDDVYPSSQLDSGSSPDGGLSETEEIKKILTASFGEGIKFEKLDG